MRFALSYNRTSGLCAQWQILEVHLSLFALAVSNGDSSGLVFTIFRPKVVD